MHYYCVVVGEDYKCSKTRYLAWTLSTASKVLKFKQDLKENTTDEADAQMKASPFPTFEASGWWCGTSGANGGASDERK